MGNKGPRKLPGMDFWLMNARPTPPRMLLKKPALCSSNLTALAASQNKSSQTPMSNSVLNKTWLLDSRGNANSLNAKSRTAPPGWTMPRQCPQGRQEGHEQDGDQDP